MTTCNKAQANTSRPEEARLRLPDPGQNLPRDGEPLASPFCTYPEILSSALDLLWIVVDGLGVPFDGTGALSDHERRRVEVKAPGIIERKSVHEPGIPKTL
ncbi:atp synthase subunit alpha, mitochondrial [Nicotiana attenuata]|uniref:Atp synthase subunit alpha, mitochondrial n=1 Tax=Nicotiana attenuata TaxID=49451 RepID=A0A314L9W8_NICAT|nr:atp synthase subunit alpha, mitochondrial [Nicotiana attenuata]